MDQPERKRRTLHYEKCRFCRASKKKCEPLDRVWPGNKCNRCKELDLECSENERTSAAQSLLPVDQTLPLVQETVKKTAVAHVQPLLERRADTETDDDREKESVVSIVSVNHTPSVEPQLDRLPTQESKPELAAKDGLQSHYTSHATHSRQWSSSAALSPLLPPPHTSSNDPQPRYGGYDNGTSPLPIPPYPPPPFMPASQPLPVNYGSYPPGPLYPAPYSSAHPLKKKLTRASQACDECRQLKAKCDETRPCCKPCRDRGTTCKYRDPVPKQNDKMMADILEGITSMKNTLDMHTSHLGRMDKRLTRIETAFARGCVPLPFKPDSVAVIGSEPETESGVRPPSPFVPLRMTPEDDLEAEPGPPVPPGEPAIPINHTTLAGLLLEWPSIRELTRKHLEREGIHYISEYPIGREQRRGPLVIYGSGEDSHHLRHSLNADMPDDTSDVASPAPPSDFGSPTGMNWSESVDVNLDFTESKVWMYVKSFKTHILSMHPVVQLRDLDNWVRHFLNTLPATQMRSSKFQVGMYSVPGEPAAGSKRKRSPGPDGIEGFPKSGKPKRSSHSALVLTILALGKICQHRGSVPDISLTLTADHGVCKSPVARNGTPSSPSGRLSPPALFSNTNAPTHPSPKDQDELSTQTRRASIHGTRGYRSTQKNQDVIPGLEYFAYASDILGNLTGAYNSMKDVYANIFASMYYGQLGRPLESYAFVHKASHKVQVILRPSLDRLRKMKNNHEFIQQKRHNQLALVFWTCLQLESDLIAELPLSPSALLSYEDDMPHPNMSLLEGFDQRVLDSYLGQLYLRVHLNSIYRMFYAPDDPKKARQDESQNVELVADAVSGMHWVPPTFVFSEDDPPANDILDVRLREKYWGAQAITYRPFIRQILHFSHSIQKDPSSPNPPVWSEFRHGIIAPAIHPETKSLSEIEPRVIELAKKGIRALVESTRAFHYLGHDRPIITNIFGTCHAQWGNLLVLSAAFKDPVLHQYVDESVLQSLFHHTIAFFHQSATKTSSLQTDLHILEGLQRDLFPDMYANYNF